MDPGKQVIIYGAIALVASLLFGRIGLALVSLAAIIVGIVIMIKNKKQGEKK